MTDEELRKKASAYYSKRDEKTRIRTLIACTRCHYYGMVPGAPCCPVCADFLEKTK